MHKMAVLKNAIFKTSNNTANMPFVPLPLHKQHVLPGPLYETPKLFKNGARKNDRIKKENIMAKNDFTPNDYLEAAKERLNDSNILKQNTNNIIGCVYFAGVSIECIFRAYIYRYTKEFDEKHNLIGLYNKSLINQNLTPEEKESLTISLKKVSKYWNNNLRYTSGKRLKRVLGHEIAKEKNQPTNIHKYFEFKIGEIIYIAENILKIGEEKWN